MTVRPQPAFLVHVLTASGAGLALLALQAAVAGSWSAMFAWLGAALLVDAADGPVARYLRVGEALPRWSGEILDLVIDFATYVFVPGYAITASGLLPAPLDTAAGIAIVTTGAVYFADRRMKTHDNYFRGFPAVWNCVAFYLLLLRPSSPVTAAVVALFAALTFVPVPFLHPLRVKRLRGVNLALLAAWAALALIAVARGMAPGSWVVAALCAIGLYFGAAGLFRFARPESRPQS